MRVVIQVRIHHDREDSVDGEVVDIADIERAGPLAVSTVGLTTFMVGALILNLGFAKDVLAEGVRDQFKAWPANLVLMFLGLTIAYFAQTGRDRASGVAGRG